MRVFSSYSSQVLGPKLEAILRVADDALLLYPDRSRRLHRWAIPRPTARMSRLQPRADRLYVFWYHDLQPQLGLSYSCEARQPPPHRILGLPFTQRPQKRHVDDSILQKRVYRFVGGEVGRRLGEAGGSVWEEGEVPVLGVCRGDTGAERNRVWNGLV